MLCLLSLVRYIRKIAGFAWVEYKILPRNEVADPAGVSARQEVRFQRGSPRAVYTLSALQNTVIKTEEDSYVARLTL